MIVIDQQKISSMADDNENGDDDADAATRSVMSWCKHKRSREGEVHHQNPSR